MRGKQKAQFQCINCGTIHWMEDPPDTGEDELYIKLKCNRCNKIVKHLWVGTEPGDEYLYYDVTKDKRYFIYNTIQND